MSSNKYSDYGSPPLEQSRHQSRSHQLEQHQELKYPPILPYATIDSPSLHTQSSEPKCKAKSQGNIRACDICRRKKIKCVISGSERTCKNCRTNNIECTYNECAKKRGPPKGYKADLNNRLKRLETLLSGLTNDGQTTEVTNDGGTPTKSASTTPISSRSSISRGLLSTNNVSTSNTMEKTTLSHVDYTDISNPAKRSKQIPRAMIVGQPRYVDDVGILPFLAGKFNLEDERLTDSISTKIRRIGKTLVVVDEEGAATNGRTLNQLILEDIGILKPGEAVLSIDDWILKVAGITKKTSDQLLKIYFSYIHLELPVVDKTLFLKQYRGLASDFPPAPLLNAMYGAATRYMEKCQAIGEVNYVQDTFDKDLGVCEIPEGGSEGFYEKLMEYIKGIHASSITTVQALAIVQNHRAGMKNEISCGWLLCATAVRMAQDLGLQRSSETLDISETEKETRRRVWWATYIMDKWGSASTGRPQNIFEEDCDQEYPSESAPWEEVMDVGPGDMADDQQPRFPSLDPSIAKNVKGETVPLYQPFMQVAKLSEILGRILQGLYTPLAKKHSAMCGSDVIVAELDKALSDWRAALPPTLQLSGTTFQKLDSFGKTPLISISVLLYLAYCTLLILLHRPFIVRHGEPKTKSSESSLSICISAATRCMDVASSLQIRDYIVVPWNFVIYHVFTASMILSHTAIYSDNVTSDLAKDQLIKGLRVIKDLSRFSAIASQLYQVLLQLMRARDIPTDNLLSEYDTHHQNTDSSVRTPTTVHSTPPNDIKATGNTITDIQTEKSPNNLKIASQTAPESMQQHHEQLKNDSSNSTEMMNYDWINGLYTSFKQGPFNRVSQYPDSDPNSLEQFGQNIEQMFTPIDQFYDMDQVSNPIPISQSQQVAYAAAGVPQNFLFGLPNTELTGQKSQHQNTTGFNVSSSAQQKYAQRGDYALPRSESGDIVPTIDNSVFRNRPDNPFWSVPSSMEIDDWDAFLLNIPFQGNGTS